MAFKDNLKTWLAEIQQQYNYSHIEKAFTHLYIREFRADHELNEQNIRPHIVDNAYDLGIDAIYVSNEKDLILIQSKYSLNDSLLQPEIDKADKFLSAYFELKGNKEDLISQANKALGQILRHEVFPEMIKGVRFIYLCGSFSSEIRSSLLNLQSKFQSGNGKEFYMELTDIPSLEALYDPYHISNTSEINIIGTQYYDLPIQEITIDNYPADIIKTKSCVFSAQALSLKYLYENLGDALFEANVRNFLSFRKPINKSIKKEIEKAEKSNLWHFNNGLVAICEGFTKENGKIKANNLQIVNGGQTVRTIANVNYIDSSVGVNVKLISIDNSNELNADARKSFMNELAINSNRQNPINSRDLKSNDLLQRELQKRFQLFDWFLHIKAGEEKIEDWKSKLKKRGNYVMNSTLVGYYVSFYLQKTNASAGRTALAFLDSDEGDDVINYESIFGTKASLDKTFKKHLLSLLIARRLDDYRKRDIIIENFPFHFYSLNLMLSLVGYWVYLNENPTLRTNEYSENAVRDFLNSDNFKIDKYLTINNTTKTIQLNNTQDFDKIFEFYTEKIHDRLHANGIANQFRKIINLFKNDGTVKEYASAFKATIALKNLYLK
jgi:hypothetical protein